MSDIGNDLPYAPQAGAKLLYGPATGSTEQGSPGILVSILVTTVGTTLTQIFDNGLGVASGTIVAEIPTTAVAGTEILCNMGFNHGLTVGGATTNAAFTASIGEQ